MDKLCRCLKIISEVTCFLLIKLVDWMMDWPWWPRCIFTEQKHRTEVLDSKRAVQKKKQPNILGTEKRDWPLGWAVREDVFFFFSWKIWEMVVWVYFKHVKTVGKKTTVFHSSFRWPKDSLRTKGSSPLDEREWLLLQGTPPRLLTRRSRKISTRNVVSFKWRAGLESGHAPKLSQGWVGQRRFRCPEASNIDAILGDLCISSIALAKDLSSVAPISQLNQTCLFRFHRGIQWFM